VSISQQIEKKEHKVPDVTNKSIETSVDIYYVPLNARKRADELEPLYRKSAKRYLLSTLAPISIKLHS
jgi:hypothetical protein